MWSQLNNDDKLLMANVVPAKKNDDKLLMANVVPAKQ
jgi:hypothetical protein